MNVKFDLNTALDDLGWRRSDLCARLGIHRNTVAAWPEGEVPKYVVAYVELALTARRFALRALGN